MVAICLGVSLNGTRSVRGQTRAVEGIVPKHRRALIIGPVLALSVAALSLSAQTRTVQGIVFDASEQRPVAGAEVSLLDTELDVVAEGLTEESGRFSLEVVVAGTLTLVASAEGYHHTAPEELGPEAATSTVVVELRRVEGAGTVRTRVLPDSAAGPARLLGRVIDVKSGRPVSDVAVAVDSAAPTALSQVPWPTWRPGSASRRTWGPSRTCYCRSTPSKT